MALALRALAPGKINLALVLGAVRGDGRHQLVTLFESISLADELWLTELDAEAGPDQVCCPGVPEPNLVSRALQGLRDRGWDGPPVRVEIAKRIPVAAGMGGGSADAAATLRLARHLGGTNEEWIAGLAIELGADVPGQLAPGLALGTGAGELVAPIAPIAHHALVIVPLPFPLSTPAVFGEADRLGLPRTEAGLSQRGAELTAALAPGAVLPPELIVNELEPAARSLCPEIDGALAQLRAAGAQSPFVCGSGATCAGLWWGEDALVAAAGAATALACWFPGATAAVPVGPEAGRVARR
ncbi:MAG: 4-(cytidine 5'-diphospho)-2-C-methyl-D-erythritol kinase [Actinomycetota bacterium]|nr:4-(cytidine 5'-diphospho)-2-C-methyl-D-erythritol kinase [Actinomycetota bacterium]